MAEHDFLAARFEAHRTHLHGVALRLLGSRSEAEDAVQEAWLKLSRAGAAGVENLGGWLTTVVSRVCLDMLRARRSRPEGLAGARAPEAVVTDADPIHPEHEARLADSVGLALLVVLQTLPPAERVAFVLHDMFDLPFDEIAGIVGRSSTAARQLASRARRRVHGAPAEPGTDLAVQRRIVEAFLAASRDGDLEGLIAVLAPDVVFRSDATAVRAGGPGELRGAGPVAHSFSGRARGARPVVVDGGPGVAVARDGHVFLVLRLTIEDGRICEIEAIADPSGLAALEVTAP